MNSGRKNLELTTEEKKQRAKELAKGIAKVSVTKDLKKRCLDMLKADDPTEKIKDNAFAKLATKLLERELQERADPTLAAKRVLKGTPLEDLAEPRKRARGQRSSGTTRLLCACKWLQQPCPHQHCNPNISARVCGQHGHKNPLVKEYVPTAKLMYL